MKNPQSAQRPINSEEMGLLAAVRARPLLVVTPIAILAVLALLIGLVRPASYTAEARLAVGRIDVDTQAAPGVVYASQSLASAYSRAIGADEVDEEIERALGEDQLDGPVEASPVPESPVILIEAEESDAADAIRLANAAGEALINFINGFNDNRGNSKRLLERYQTAQERVLELETAPATVSNQAELEAARIEATSYRDTYRETLDSDTGDDLRFLTRAEEASSDRRTVLQLLLFAAIVAGGGIGLLLAYRERGREPPRPGRTTPRT